MERYDYYKAMEEDIRSYLDETDERDYQTLYDEMFVSDRITGNASGSYTFSAYQAEEYICHNLYLLGEACQEFGSDAGEILMDGAENADVTIRCYVLGQVLNDVLVDYMEEESEDEDEDSEDESEE